MPASRKIRKCTSSANRCRVRHLSSRFARCRCCLCWSSESTACIRTSRRKRSTPDTSNTANRAGRTTHARSKRRRRPLRVFIEHFAPHLSRAVQSSVSSSITTRCRRMPTSALHASWWAISACRRWKRSRVCARRSPCASGQCGLAGAFQTSFQSDAARHFQEARRCARIGDWFGDGASLETGRGRAKAANRSEAAAVLLDLASLVRGYMPGRWMRHISRAVANEPAEPRAPRTTARRWCLRPRGTARSSL